jgi:branched-chain amino acid transport system substrate-binding protein
MKTMLGRRFAAVFACAGLGLATPSLAQDKTVKIGVLNDMSSLYADIGGANSVAAIKMAVEDSGLTKKGWKIDVLSGDHQNKPDVGTNLARQWIDNEKVDVIADTPNSGVALAVSNLVREKNAVLLNSGAATADLTGKACTPNTVSFTYDTYMLANGTGKALTKAGGSTWFFLTSDYAFGHALERDTTLSSPPAAARCWAGSSIRSIHRISPRSCCRHRPRKPRSSGWPMPAATPPTRSSRPPNSASSPAARNWLRCCCSSTTCIRSA